jgi:hypothetical protein
MIAATKWAVTAAHFVPYSRSAIKPELFELN